MMMDKVGFVGFGLIGGSIAKSLKKYNLVNTIIAYDQNIEALKQAFSDQVIDVISESLEDGFDACDLIFLCCPVQVNIQLCRLLSDLVQPNCIITDVGSTKCDIHAGIQDLNINTKFIGGHPMTGSEKSGYEASNAQLFENVYYILTPTPTTHQKDLECLKSLIEGIDSIPLIMSAKDHDIATASISHVPHILAAILVNTVEELDQENGYMHTLAAGGFKDITRIASSSPTMWQQICLTNKTPILKTLSYMTTYLEQTIHLIEQDDEDGLVTLFKDAREYRSTFNDSNKGLLPSDYSFSIDVDDEPGIIARIATLLYEEDINIKNIGIVNNREIDKGVLKIQFSDQKHMNLSIHLLTELGFTIYR